MTQQPPRPGPENLYLVLEEYGEEEAPEGEYFTRALVYAPSDEAARAVVADYIDLCNEAEEATPSSDGTEEPDEEEEEELETIYYDRDRLRAVVLARDVTRPEDIPFDADDILVFETEWEEEEWEEWDEEEEEQA